MNEWRNIPGFPGYQASDGGHIRSLMRKVPRVLSPDVGHAGHLRVTLATADGYRRVFVHRLVAATFIGEPPAGTGFIDHVDRDPSNNEPGNLRWCSLSQNNRNRPADGVTFEAQKKRWRARIRGASGRKLSLGMYITKSEAIEAYRKARREHHGEFACER